MGAYRLRRMMRGPYMKSESWATYPRPVALSLPKGCSSPAEGRGFDRLGPNGVDMAHTGGTVTIAVNGERRRVAAGLSLAGLAPALGLEPEKVAVERNRASVPPPPLAGVGENGKAACRGR